LTTPLPQDPFLRACNWSPDAQCCSFCGDDSHRGEAGACTAIFLHAMPVAATGRWQKYPRWMEFLGSTAPIPANMLAERVGTKTESHGLET